jgi:hypothetical protein
MEEMFNEKLRQRTFLYDTFIEKLRQRTFLYDTFIETLRQRTFLYDTKSPCYRDQHMRANAWEEIGKELEIKRKT